MRKIFAAFFVTALFAGCSASYFVDSADREVAPILREMNDTVEGERLPSTPSGVITPKSEAASREPQRPRDVSMLERAAYAVRLACGEGYDCFGALLASMGPAGGLLLPGVPAGGVGRAVLTAWRAAAEGAPRIERTRYLDLEGALAIAFSNSRDFRRQKEALYLTALSYTLVRHDFSWRPSGTVSAEIATDGGGSGQTVDTADADAALTLARTLLSGGAVSVSASVSQRGAMDGPADDGNSSSLSASLRHNLLAGTGAAAREALVQARRNLLFAARDFELFRQDLAISTIRQYLDLLRQRRFIESAGQRVEQATFLYERSKALFDKGTLTKVDEFRAKQGLLEAANDLNTQRESYSLALDRFKISLGIATDENVDVAEESIEPEIVEVNLSRAVEIALENRLDLITAREQLEDAERAVEISRNALLPELEVFAEAQVSSESAGDLLDYRKDDGSAALGLRLSGFLDKKAERNAYRSSLIALARQRRAYTLAVDNVKLEVRDTVSNLRRAEVTLAIRAEQVKLAEDTVEAALIQLERGEKSNRDVVEAQTQLQGARNALVQAKVDYLIALIELRRNIGTLRVNERGQWR